VRAVIQRVTEASVRVGAEEVARIGAGLVVLLGVGVEDTERDAQYIATKVSGLRIFDDAQGKMNLSAGDVGGAVLLVSQFTLYGDCRKGRRPSFTEAAGPEKAESLYQAVADRLRARGLLVEQGRFQASMQVSLVNDGPVTLLLDSARAGGE
jgi:D-tyrosyl-tRNA(Tyr) deacylase